MGLASVRTERDVGQAPIWAERFGELVWDIETHRENLEKLVRISRQKDATRRAIQTQNQSRFVFIR